MTLARFHFACFCFASLTLMSNMTYGQPVSNRANATNNQREISVQQSFDPAFSIEPLYHQLSGRPGDAISFKFQMMAKDSSAQIEVSPVGLRQDITGQITFDPLAQATELITLVSPASMTLERDKPTNIEGIVQIPRSNTQHHSLGLLVKDLGRKTDVPSKVNPDGTRTTQAAINFVTQYILRLDLDVTGARGESGSVLQIDDVRLVPFNGRPKLQAIVTNNSDSTFEFELRARVKSNESDRNKPIRLILPCKSNIQEETRYTSRILPKTKVRMEDLLPEAIASGKYEADLELFVNERSVRKASHPLFVDARDYPAQETLIAQVGEDLQVSPAQIELSQLRGGNRRLTVQLKNTSDESKSISLKARTIDMLDSQSITIQPAEFVLAPNSTRKVALTLKGKPTATETTEYGSLVVDAKTERRDFRESRELPMALLFKKQPTYELELFPLVWENRGENPGFRTTVKNIGAGHVPLDARLSIFSKTGVRINSYAGFGKWLMPGKSQSLEFRLEQPLQPGEYLLRYEIQNGTDKPLSKDQSITVTDLENAVTIK